MRKIIRRLRRFFVEEYQPTFTITNEILKYVSSISEKIGRITATSNLESKLHLKIGGAVKKE